MSFNVIVSERVRTRALALLFKIIALLTGSRR